MKMFAKATAIFVPMADQNGQKSPSTVNERPAAKKQPPRISRDRKRPSSEKSATNKLRPRDETSSLKRGQRDQIH